MVILYLGKEVQLFVRMRNATFHYITMNDQLIGREILEYADPDLQPFFHPDYKDKIIFDTDIDIDIDTDTGTDIDTGI